jgi:hypothetical protein
MTSAKHKDWDFTSSVENITGICISDLKGAYNFSSSEALKRVFVNLISVLVEKKIIKTEEFQEILETDEYILCDEGI